MDCRRSQSPCRKGSSCGSAAIRPIGGTILRAFFFTKKESRMTDIRDPVKRSFMLRLFRLEVLTAQVLDLGHLLNGRNGELLGHALGHRLGTDLLGLRSLLLGGLYIIHHEDIDA